jgi:hypothetical protein
MKDGSGGRRLADMSLPPQLRGRTKKSTSSRKPVSAQEGHATGQKADKIRRDMARKEPRQRKKNQRGLRTVMVMPFRSKSHEFETDLRSTTCNRPEGLEGGRSRILLTERARLAN